MVSASAGQETCHLQSQGLQTGLLENYNLALAFLYYRQSWKEFLLLFHPWPEKMLLVNLPSMLTKGLSSILLSHPEQEFSYFFFTMQSVTLPTISCPMALYSCSTLHTLQLLRTHPCIISSSPYITNWSLLLSMISFLLSFIQTATSQLAWLHPEDGGSTFFWEDGTHPTDYSVKKCTPNFGLF